MWYSFGRFFVESIRLDPSDIFFGLRTNQISALVGLLVGLALFLYQREKHTGDELTGYLPGRFNRQLAEQSAPEGSPEGVSEGEKTEQTAEVEGTEVGLTKSKEKN